MKHGKNPTVKQKKMLTALKLNAENWLIVKNTPQELCVVHKISGEIRKINKNYI